jgi:glycosyltransferase involved in cell wall biosynthesis
MITSKEKPVRILHVLGSLDRGGVETWLIHVLRHIDRDAFQFDFCCLSGEEGIYAPEAKLYGSQVFPIKLTGNLASFNRQLVRLLQEQRYDVVHSHVHHFSGHILECSKKAGVQTRIAHSHSAPPHRTAALFRRTYLWYMKQRIRQFATVGVGVSNAAMIALFGNDWENDKRWRLSYCGIDASSFKFNGRAARRIREQYNIPAHAKVIGHVGSFSEPKNHQFMLEIARTIGGQRNDVWFLFVGDGALRADIERQAAEQGIPRLIFVGIQSDVADFLSAMDLFLFPSKWEGLPLSVVEAQASGLCCLCSDAVTSEVVVDRVHFLPLNRPSTEWVQVILSMLTLPQVDRLAVWKAVAYSSFSIEHSVQSLARLYQQLSSS